MTSISGERGLTLLELIPRPPSSQLPGFLTSLLPGTTGSRLCNSSLATSHPRRKDIFLLVPVLFFFLNQGVTNLSAQWFGLRRFPYTPHQWPATRSLGCWEGNEEPWPGVKCHLPHSSALRIRASPEQGLCCLAQRGSLVPEVN